MTVNVEYNQIDALLRATVEPRGDVAGPDTGGFSPYPGSINQLLFELKPYAEKLRKTGGTMLVATHSARVASFCDRVLELHNGRLGDAPPHADT